MHCRISAIVLAFVEVCAHATDRKQNEFIPFLTDAEWAVTESDNPAGLAPTSVVQRIEPRPGDYLSKPPFKDCTTGVERAELAQCVNTSDVSNQPHWYRWKLFFPEDIEGTYPARNGYRQFIEPAS
jgi:hypothetical protein